MRCEMRLGRFFTVDVSIVIPTKNAGTGFRNILDAVFSQNTDCSFEVICVDSGSSDGTVELIREYPALLKQIPPEEYGHGKTRNLGASLGSGDYIVFITQDALPVDEHWLQGFVDAMRLEEGIVGAFGKHVPYPECNLLDARDITGLFDSYGNCDRVICVDDWERYRTDIDYVRWLAFFSDNNACILRSEWEKHPYPEVDFAEDQLWMGARMSEGKKKVYAAHAMVYHSHNFNVRELMGRYYDEYQALNQLFDGFMIVDRWLNVPRSICDSIRGDCSYVDGLATLSNKEKRRWKRYARQRDFAKILFGFLGGRSNRWSQKNRVWMDWAVSQQYKQRHA